MFKMKIFCGVVLFLIVRRANKVHRVNISVAV